MRIRIGVRGTNGSSHAVTRDEVTGTVDALWLEVDGHMVSDRILGARFHRDEGEDYHFGRGFNGSVDVGLIGDIEIVPCDSYGAPLGDVPSEAWVSGTKEKLDNHRAELKRLTKLLDALEKARPSEDVWSVADESVNSLSEFIAKTQRALDSVGCTVTKLETDLEKYVD